MKLRVVSGAPQFVGDAVAALDIHIREDHAMFSLRETPRTRFADSARTARHDHHFPIRLHIHLTMQRTPFARQPKNF
jgi:hypothetical protein